MSGAGRKLAHLLVGALVGALLMQPAFANHTPKHTKKQIKKLNQQVKLRYTKAEVDALLAGKAGVGDSHTKPEADARFVRYARTLVVSPVGAAAQNGAALRQAAGSITDASPTNPYLLHIEPGIYDLGSAGVVLPANVDVEGSGRGATMITCACGSEANTSTAPGAIGPAVLRQGANTEIRSLTVENTGGHDHVHGIDVAGEPSDAFSISDVVVEAEGASQKGVGIWAWNSSDVRLRDVEASAYGTGPSTSYYGIELSSLTRARLVGVIARGQGVVSRTYGLVAQQVTDLQIEGGRYEAKDASQNFAIRLEGCDAEIKGVTSAATGGGDAYHALYSLNSNFLVTGSTLEGMGEEGYGVTLVRDQSGTSIGRVDQSVVTTVSTVCCGYGVSATGSAGIRTLFVGSSEVVAQGPSARASGATSSIRIGGTMLGGDPVQQVGSGVVTCAGVWDEAHVFSASVCP